MQFAQITPINRRYSRLHPPRAVEDVSLVEVPFAQPPFSLSRVSSRSEKLPKFEALPRAHLLEIAHA